MLLPRVLLVIVLLASAASMAAEPQGPEQEAQLETIEAFEAAWERNDIEAMLGYCSDDMEYVNAGAGFYWRTLEELRKGWAFERQFGALPKATDRTFRDITSDVGIVVTRYAIYGEQAAPGSTPVGHGITSFIMKRQGDRWLISYSQSTLVNPQATAPQ